MTAIRQDAWNHDEDLLLAETVLRHIREGSTQLAAFDEVGKKLSRTSAACGFRWNSLVRKKYENAIALAKKQRKQLKLKRKQTDVKPVNDHSEKVGTSQSILLDHGESLAHKNDVSLDKVIHYLSHLNAREQTYLTLEKENADLRKQVEEATHTRDQLRGQLEQLQAEYQLMQDDYKAMMAIMERARKMVVYDEPDSSIRIQMATHEPAEKINK